MQQKRVDEDLANRFKNTPNFFDEDLGNFCLVLQVFIHMSTWITVKKSMNHHCQKKNINSILTMEDIADDEYKHIKKN